MHLLLTVIQTTPKSERHKSSRLHLMWNVWNEAPEDFPSFLPTLTTRLRQHFDLCCNFWNWSHLFGSMISVFAIALWCQAKSCSLIQNMQLSVSKIFEILNIWTPVYCSMNQPGIPEKSMRHILFGPAMWLWH